MRRAKTENLNYQVERESAKSVQKSLLVHQVDEQKIQDAMRFLGVVLGGMSSSFYPENEQELRVAEILGNIRQRIEKGLPEDVSGSPLTDIKLTGAIL